MYMSMEAVLKYGVWLQVLYVVYVLYYLVRRAGVYVIVLLASSSINYAPLCAIPTWWRHQMETFSALLAFCAGNSPVTGDFPAQGLWTLDFFFQSVPE